MYKIMQGETVLGTTENIVFTRKTANGYYTECSRENAQGFVYNGEIYSLGGADGYADKEIAVAEECDSGAILSSIQEAVDDLVITALMGGGNNV